MEDGAAAPEETGLLPEETASSEARQAEGEGGVPLDEAHFPDERFRNYIQNLYNDYMMAKNSLAVLPYTHCNEHRANDF